MVTVPVSVIIPCYRCSDVIERAVRSVLTQTALPEEIIFIDDCSSDGITLETLNSISHQFQKKYPMITFKVIERERNGGPGSARNIGWDHATKDFIAFLDADDAWLPQKLEFQYKYMTEHPECSLTGHLDVLYNDNSSIKYDLEAEIKTKEISINRLFLKNEFLTRTVMIRKEIIYRFANMYRGEDYYLWLVILQNGGHGSLILLPLAYRFEDNREHLTKSLKLSHKGEVDAIDLYKEECQLNYIKYVFIRCWLLLKYLRRIVVSGLKRV